MPEEFLGFNIIPNKFYVGLCEPAFKGRYGGHKTSFSNIKHKGETELSKYIWELKDNHVSYSIKFSVLLQCSPRRAGSDHCNLCAWEKVFIMKGGEGMLNTRDELISKCRHINKFLLKQYKT